MVEQPEQILPSKKHPAWDSWIATKATRAELLADMPPMVYSRLGSTVEIPIPRPQPSAPLRVITPRFRPKVDESGTE